jgi:hypothetical protein
MLINDTDVHGPGMDLECNLEGSRRGGLNGYRTYAADIRGTADTRSASRTNPNLKGKGGEDE